MSQQPVLKEVKSYTVKLSPEDLKALLTVTRSIHKQKCELDIKEAELRVEMAKFKRDEHTYKTLLEALSQKYGVALYEENCDIDVLTGEVKEGDKNG